MNHKFAIVILGAGVGGYIAALKAAQMGNSVAIVEKDKIGGMCLNWGCIPSKSLLKSAKAYNEMKQAAQLGIDGIESDKLRLNWARTKERAFTTVGSLTGGVRFLLEKNGVWIFQGRGRVTGLNTLEVNGEILEFEHLIIATGSVYTTPFVGEGQDKIYTPKNIYDIERLPQTIAIVGGGLIGIEFAYLFSSLGVEVSLFEQKNHLIPFMDDDVIQFTEEMMAKRHIRLFLNSKVKEFSDGCVTYEVGGTVQREKSDILLSAITRKANLEGLDFLLLSGLQLHNGYIKSDLRCRTSLPQIYAVGDVNGRWMLAHVASAEGSTAVETINGKGEELIYDMMPVCIYSFPEISAVGFTERGAVERGFLVEVVKFPVSMNGKALATGSGEGFVKVVADKKFGEILGVHIVAEDATDLISESLLAMQSHASLYEMGSIVHTHPTFSGVFLEATLQGLRK
jgi:dihydrolipoamide dehydrogenase